MPDVLLIGDSERSTELRQEVGVPVGDPFVYAEVDGRRVAIVWSIEGERIAEVEPGIEIVPSESFTVEDIIEEVVGEIDDETDPAGGEVRRLANGDWFVRGHVAVTDLIDHGIELPVDSDAYNSIGGFVFSELGRLPKRGDTVTVDGYSIRVEAIQENRVEAVRIRERRPQATVAPDGR